MVSTRLWRSTAYVPNHFAHVVRRFNLVFVPQLAIMNGSSILGRILPNLLAQKIGLYNTFVPISFCTGALIFALYGVKNAGGTVVIAVIYGFFSGACAYIFVGCQRCKQFSFLCCETGLAVSAPTAASMAKDPSEVG